MKSFLLILLFTYFAPLQCSKTKYFLVTRQDNKEAICIRPSEGYYLFPTFDLDKLQIPQDVGFKYWDWLGDWKSQNDTDVRRIGENQVLIAGNHPFNFVARNLYQVAVFNFLAANITLWMADKDRTRGGGLLFEMDHLNETTKLKDTTLKYCDENPELEGAKCTILDYKNGTNFLNDGNHWIPFVILLKEYPTGVEMVDRSYGKNTLVVQWTRNNSKITNPFTSYRFDIFAKSHQRNAAIFYYGTEDHYQLDLANNKDMKRKYTKRSSGEFCVKVRWNKQRSNDSIELMEVKNLVSRRLQPPTNTTHGNDLTHFQWNHLAAGEYEFTLRLVERQPRWIDLCLDSGSNIERTWVSMPKAISKCQFHVGLNTEFSMVPSSPPDPKIKTNWTFEEWEIVCDRLGIGFYNTEVPIKFCDLNGCNFSKCPHLQHEPAYIFDF